MFQLIQYITIRLLFCALLALFSSCVDTSEKQIIGVKIYEHPGRYVDLMAEWKDIGINTVFSSIDLYREPEFRALCSDNQLKCFIILPVFFDSKALEEDPSLYAITETGENAKEAWVQFVCPSRADFRANKLALFKDLIKELQPDGVSIDFIRHFAYWEKIYENATIQELKNTCFDTHCMELFENQTNTNLPDSITRASDRAWWLLNFQKDAWIQWKCNLITQMVADISREASMINPDILINIHIVPWKKEDFGGAIKSVIGQDLSALAAHTHYLSPMTYSHMLKKQPGWIHSVVNDMYAQTNHKILPSIQVEKAYLDTPFTIAEFKDAISSALQAPSRGVVLWSWEHISTNEGKKKVLKELVKGDSKN